jgi:Txe/YoeB family toxin of Txe-Axe toxin-antitoxin module
MKNIQFRGQAYEELLDWVETDPKLFEKIKTLLK